MSNISGYKRIVKPCLELFVERAVCYLYNQYSAIEKAIAVLLRVNCIVSSFDNI
jgi:hypothetical protein